MISGDTSSIPNADMFPRLLDSDSTCSQVFPGAPEGQYVSPVNSGRCMDATQLVALATDSMRFSVRAYKVPS